MVRTKAGIAHDGKYHQVHGRVLFKLCDALFVVNNLPVAAQQAGSSPPRITQVLFQAQELTALKRSTHTEFVARSRMPFRRAGSESQQLRNMFVHR